MTLLRYMSVLTACSVFAALMSIVWQAFVSLKQLNKITTLLTVFLSIESSIRRLTINETVAATTKIAIGYGACSDLLISGIHFLNYTPIVFRHSEQKEFAYEEIQNRTDLLESFAYFFQSGAAAERFMSNTELFNSLIKKAKSDHREQIKWFLGGNAALMGVRFYLEGADVLLGARMSNKLRRLVPNQIKITGDPIEEDEIHLILEYKAGDKWGELTAPRANRFIVHNDHNNPKLQVVEQFGAALDNFQPRLLVITGLHVMDRYKFEPGMREARLLKVQQQLTSQSPMTLSHFEMASYVDLELLKLLCKHVLPNVDSLGMNEQELSNLVAVLKTEKITTATDWNPEVAVSLDQMRYLYKYLATDYYHNINAQRRLNSRIHLHTLAYQVLLTKRDSQWRHATAAVSKASLIAHRYVCQTEMINPEAAMLLLPDKYYTSMLPHKRRAIELDVKNPVACWDEQIEIDDHAPIEVEFCVAPVLVCRVAKKAAGAGDNISAAALALQV